LQFQNAISDDLKVIGKRYYYRLGYIARSAYAGISVTEGAILKFFAPRHVAPIGVNLAWRGGLDHPLPPAECEVRVRPAKQQKRACK